MARQVIHPRNGNFLPSHALPTALIFSASQAEDAAEARAKEDARAARGAAKADAAAMASAAAGGAGPAAMTQSLGRTSM
jgi:hypothetical protein